MRKVLISLVIVTLFLTISLDSTGDMTDQLLTSTSPIERPQGGVPSLATAGGTGNSLSSRQYMSRVITSEQISILNTYADTSTHSGEIDVSSNLYSGWHVYEVTIDVNSMVAAPEREIIAETNNNTNFQMTELAGTFYSQLVQGFYDQPFDGELQNYSIYYYTDRYSPPARGNASFAITSNYNTSSVMTTPLNVTASEGIPIWTTIGGESVALDANSVYWALINGSTCYQDTAIFEYPSIIWVGQDNIGQFESKWYDPPPNDEWDERSVEALLNYTYTPWNRTAGAALQFSTPENLSLLADSVAQTGLSWTFTDGVSNITSIQFDTNQSIYLDYNVTLWYQESASTSTTWDVDISGNPIIWNATTALSFPIFPETTANYLDITVPSDWVTVGLYNSTNPGTDYGHNSKIGNIVTCTALDDETWILSSTAHNYVDSIALSDSFDSSPITGEVSYSVDMDIDATIEDGSSNPISGGLANLTVHQTGSAVYKPDEIAATAGVSSFLWDISVSTTGNGTHTVEVFWTNGTEAGYYTVDVFVFYPTDLVADDLTITAYTENTFDIGIDFDQLEPVRGLDGSLAAVTYSFDAIVNDTLDDDGGGRWSKTVSTATMSSGTYILTVYAEGFALENQSLTVTVDLTIETQTLNWSWSNTNDITYLDSTNLTVTYQDLSNTRISDAWVNVTFDAQTFNLTWDASSEVYWIELTGSNFTTVPGTTNLTVSAWKVGYTTQTTSNVQILISVESTGVGLVVTWNPSDRNITYIESITITASYTYNTVPIDDTWEGVVVRATFGGYPPLDMVYNGVSELWELTLDGSDYLGTTTVTIRASATGYNQAQDVQDLLVTDDIPTLANSWTDSAASTDYDSNILLQITVRDSAGAFINGATLTANVFATNFPLVFNGDGVYSILIDPQETRGIHVVSVTIAQYGYTITSTFLNLTIRATTDIDVSYISSQYEQWNLTFTVTFTDTFHNSVITNATVTVTIDGVEYTLVYDSGEYIREIVLDFDPGTYTITVTANAPFCNEAIQTPALTIQAKAHVYLSLTTEGDPSAEGQILSIIATLTYNESGVGVPNEHIHFIVTINYANGSIELREDATQFDTTNTDGVATWGLEIPAGIIESISIEAEYLGSRVIWDTSLTHNVLVGANPIMAILAFFFIDPIGQMIVLSMIVLGVVATAYNKRVKPKKRAARASLENQLQMFRDLETLRHFMAVYLDRGTCVFYHPFTDERIQPDLISGFIAAITSVYGEIKGDGVRGTLEEIQYHGLRLNSYSGEFIIGILILEGEMTPLLKDRLQFFVELFENQYDNELTDWNGLIDCFDPEWVVSTLSSAFNYSWLLAHRFGPTQKVAKADAKILDYISAVRDDRSEFYFRDVLTPLAEMLDISEAAVLDRLLALQDRGIIAPVSIQTILQRQGMGLANGEIGADSIQLEVPEKEETPVEEPEPVEEEPDTADDFVEEVETLMSDEPEEKKEEVDPMDEFVKDVESLLTKEKDKDENE